MFSDIFHRFRRSIAASFILMVLLVLSIGQGTLWIWFLFTQKSQAHEMLLDKVSLVASLTSEQVQLSLEGNDIKELTHFLETMVIDKDIISIRVRDNDNNVKVQVSSTVKGRKSTLNPFYVNWQNKYVLDIGPRGSSLGSVVVTYSGERVNSFMTSLMTVAPLAQIFLFFIIIYTIYFFFQRRVGKPISMLQDSLMKVTGGDLNTHIPELKDNELGDIASGLRFLVSRLSANVQKLGNTADTVSETILILRELFKKPVALFKMQSGSLEVITRSLRQANESHADIASRTETVSSFSQENVSALLEVKATADEIVSSMDMLFKATEGSYSIVEQMSATSKVMASNSQEVLEAVENTSASVEEILASVREVERNAKESAVLAENVRELAAQRGVNVVGEAVVGMEKITERVRFAVEIVNRLEARSSDIQKILAVIKDVTERTNLLSLNASILAEQAGEYGKGFSVIADEMRALSDRTANYTKDISGIVSTIRSEIIEAVGSIEESMNMVRKGSDTVYQVGETMSDILESAYRSALMSKMIERSTEDQSKALHHIEASVIDINRMAVDMSRAMGEQSNASSYMLERVGEVREIAEATQKSTKEQAEGTRSISKNLEETNEQIAGIQELTFDQQRVNIGILSSVEEIRAGGEQTINDIEDVAVLLNKLKKEMDLLEKEMDVLSSE